MQSAMAAEKVKQSSVQKQMQGMADNLSKMEAQLKSLQGLHAVVQQQRKALEDENQSLKAELSEHYAKRLTSAASPG